MTDDDQLIETALFSLLDARATRASICPSEVARALAPRDEKAWRALMPRVRDVASALASQGRLRITRRGATLDPRHLEGGPIRLHRGHVTHGMKQAD